MTTKQTKILFDGDCIVCDFEVQNYKRLAPSIFDIQDISHPQFDASIYGLTSLNVNKHMHVITPDNQVKVGVDAFVHIWERLDKFRYLRRMIGLPIVRPIANVSYDIFASYIRPILPKKKNK